VSRDSTPIAYSVLALSALLGGVSLLAFGLALAVGPFELLGLGLSPRTALLWDGGLCLGFFVQHSGMVRASFRARLGRRLPEHYHPAVYSIASGIALLLLVGLWQTPDLSLLAVEGAPRWILRGVFVITGAGFLWAVRSLGSFDTFGLEPIRSHLRGRESRSMPLAIRGPYRWVRHPLYSLFLVLLWACPDLTADRLLFNGLFTAWIVIGTLLEERDLVRQFGEPYREYQRQVPMLVPWRKTTGAPSVP
jgi:protein-S-isoprenylcysteine O-methyltransferase Ste14